MLLKAASVSSIGTSTIWPSPVRSRCRSAAVTAEVSAMPQILSPISDGTKAGSSSVPIAAAKPEAAWMISSKAGRARQGPSWPKPVAVA